MPDPTPSHLDAAEYEAIEATMRASERGRVFLAEHARRARSADTDMLLTAMRRLEETVMNDRGPEGVGHLRGDLAEMVEAISRTKAEIAAISAPDHEQTRLALASEALDAIVRATEQATSDILGAAEAVQEAAWSLREHGVESGTCDALDRHATAIYTACSFQDLTAQRTARIVYTLRYLEDRLTAMIAIWGRDADRIPPPPETALAGPGREPPPEDLCQSDIDRYIAMEVPAVTAAAIVARPGSPALHEDIVFVPVSSLEADGAGDADVGDLTDTHLAEAWAGLRLVAPGPAPAEAPEEPGFDLAEIDAMPPEERLALFA
jgi:chemotaxis regulatin CheY-phosphate phosphatase CheZ